MIRVGVVEDSAAFREALVQGLSDSPGVEVVGAAASAEEALIHIDDWGADVVLTDLRMPGMGGVEGTRALKDRRPEIKVIALTFHREEDLIRAALAAGASGYIVKGSSMQEILAGIRDASEGRGHLSADVIPAVVSATAEAVALREERESALLELRQLRDEFLQNVNHEIRTPLTMIVGCIETISEKGDNLSRTEQGVLLDAARRSTRRLQTMLDRILAPTSVEDRRSCLLADALDEVLPRSARPVRVIGPLVETGPPVAAPKSALVTMLAELLDNADQHSVPGTEVELWASTDAPDAVLRVVSRPREAVDPDTVLRLMQPFSRGDSRGLRRQNGSPGLGLSIVARIAEAAGGSLAIDPGPERFGAEIRLPLAPAAPIG